MIELQRDRERFGLLYSLLLVVRLFSPGFLVNTLSEDWVGDSGGTSESIGMRWGNWVQALHSEMREQKY